MKINSEPAPKLHHDGGNQPEPPLREGSHHPLAMLLTLCSIAGLILLSWFWLSRPRLSYLPYALGMILLGSLPFYARFEGRRPPARELALLGVFIALAVAGRALFFFLPQIKPMAALISIGAIAMGPAAGFIIGSTAGLVSNLFFGQGLWTPFQMMGYGLVSLLMGWLFAPGRLPRRRGLLALVSALATTVIYGLLVDSSSVLLLGAGLTAPVVAGIYLAGLPFNLVHGASTALFMFWLAPTMLEKLERVSRKYGFSGQSDRQF